MGNCLCLWTLLRMINPFITHGWLIRQNQMCKSGQACLQAVKLNVLKIS